MTTQLTLGLSTRPARLSGAQLGAMAAQAAADSADRHDPGWQDRAYEAFVAYARAYPTRQFTTDDVRRAVNVPDPKEPRAWGAVALRAKRAGLVVSCGYTPIEAQRGAPKTLWKLNAP